VDPVPDPPLVRKSGSAGNRNRASGSVAKNSEHYTKHVDNLKLKILCSNFNKWQLSEDGRLRPKHVTIPVLNLSLNF
jgi:hypothetical protein